MKNYLSRFIGISMLGLLIIAGAGQKARAQDVEVSFQTFYDNLSPYGQWVSDPQYGNVWVPNEGGDFRPYGNRGHWVMTDYGNTWVSEDPWGWACYHYGRWTYDDYYGWVWIPGYEWAPAWVSWRYGGGYCGWAPLGPGVSIEFNAPESWWVFIEPTYLYHPDYYHYWRGPEYNHRYFRQTTIINNYFVDNRTHIQYNYGPKREVIERETHQPVQVYRVSQSNRPGSTNISGQRVTMYRPMVNRNTVREARPANVFQSQRPIGAPQQANAINSNRPHPFRQEVQQRQAQPGRPENQGRQPFNQQPANREQQVQPDRGRFNQQPVNREQQPQAQPDRGRFNQQPVNREQQPQAQPDRGRFNQQPVNREPQPQTQPDRGRFNQQPVNREPQPQAQPDRGRFNQQPMNRDQNQRPFQAPPRPQIQDQQRQQPAPQPRMQPAPQQQPRMQPAPQQQPRPQQAPQPRQAPEQQRQEHGRR